MQEYTGVLNCFEGMHVPGADDVLLLQPCDVTAQEYIFI